MLIVQNNKVCGADSAKAERTLMTDIMSFKTSPGFTDVKES
jgi:hypothetical protein